jgi:hypothetical protein
MARTKMLLLAVLCGMAWSQTNLTTIQDTLFTADGTRFNGILTIHWSTFDTTNPGTVVQQTKNVPVVNGNLQVSLVPDAGQQPPANIYTVQYESDGREQFTETWSVPVSATPLKVSVVRTGTLAPAVSSVGVTGNQTPILESTVVGLQADLAQRPIKGVGYGTNRVALVNDSGQIETVVGDVGDCVYVDGTAGPCGQAPVFADAETPGGIVDGVNDTLTLANAVDGASLLLFRNGLFLTPNFDYTLNGTTIKFAAGAVPRAGDTLTASYRIDPYAIGNLAALTQGGPTVPSTAAQVLCSAAGISTSATSMTSLGACDVPAGALNPGDRIEIRFNLAHTGTTSGFTFQVNWGNTPVVLRTGAGQDSAVAGRAEAAITSNGAQISNESWGTVLPFLPGIVNAPAQAGLQVNVKAALANAGSGAVALTNYTVLRYPAR